MDEFVARLPRGWIIAGRQEVAAEVRRRLRRASLVFISGDDFLRVNQILLWLARTAKAKTAAYEIKICAAWRPSDQVLLGEDDMLVMIPAEDPRGRPTFELWWAERLTSLGY